MLIVTTSEYDAFLHERYFIGYYDTGYYLADKMES